MIFILCLKNTIPVLNTYLKIKKENFSNRLISREIFSILYSGQWLILAKKKKQKKKFKNLKHYMEIRKVSMNILTLKTSIVNWRSNC